MKKKFITLLSVVFTGAMLLTGCKASSQGDNLDASTSGDVVEESEADNNEEEDSDTTASNNQQDEENKSDGVESAATNSAEQIFNELYGKPFMFCSGMGAWQTTIGIEKDGSFTGYFVDVNMGESQPKYPNGTIYVSSNVTGQFDDVKQIDDYSYSMNISKLNYIEKTEEGYEQFIADDMLYFLTSPRGLAIEDEVIVYTPGMKVADIPDECMEWVGWAIGYTMSSEDTEDKDIEDAELDTYIIYDKTLGTSFFITNNSDPEFQLPDASERKEFTGIYYSADELDLIDFEPKSPYESVTLKNLQGTWVYEYDENDGTHVLERLTIEGNHGYIENYVDGVKSSVWNGDGEAVITDRSDENKCPKFVIVDECCIYIRWVSEDEFYDGGFCVKWKREVEN